MTQNAPAPYIHWGISSKQLTWQDARFKKHYTPPQCELSTSYLLDVLTEPLSESAPTTQRTYIAASTLRNAYVQKCTNVLKVIMQYQSTLGVICTKQYKTPQKFLQAVAGLKIPPLEHSMRVLHACLQYIRELDRVIEPEFSYD